LVGQPHRLRTAALAVSFALTALISIAEPKQDEKAFQSALSLFYSGQYSRARDAFEGVFFSYPGSPITTCLSYWLGSCSLKLGEYEKALGYFRTQTTIESGRPFYSAHSRLLSGVALEALGRLAEAGLEYRAFLSDPASGPLAAEAVFRLAGLEYRGGRFDAARDLYRRVLLDFPSSGFVADSLYFLAESEMALGNLPEAGKRYQILISLYPGSPYVGSSKFRIAEIAGREGRREEALSLLDDLLGSSPAARLAAKTLRLRGDILMAGGDTPGAIDAYSRALDLAPDDLERQETLAAMGAAESFAGRVEDAAASLERAGRGPSREISEASTIRRASLLVELGREEEAQRTLERFLLDYPYSLVREKALRLLAQLSGKLGDADLGWQSWDSLVRGFPESATVAEGLYCRAMAAISLGRQAEALEDLQRIGRDFPRSEYYPWSLYAIGTVYVDRGEYSRAIPFFRSALQSASSPQLAYRSSLAIGICRFDLGSYAEALSAFDALIASDPLPALYAGRALYRMNRLDEAAQRFQKTASGTAIAAEAWYWLGWCRYRLQSYAGSKEAFLAVADGHPADARALESLLRAALCDVQLSADAEAVLLLDRALDASAGGPDRRVREEAFYQKGLALARLGRMAESRTVLQRLVQEFPGSALAAEACFKLASLAMEQGLYDDSLAGFRVVFTDFASSPLAEQALYWAGEAALAAGKPDASAELFWSFILRYPAGAFLPTVLDGMERALSAVRTLDAVRGYLEKARAPGNVSPEILSSFELVYARLLLPQSPDQALAVIEEVSARDLPDPLKAEARFLIGRHDALRGDTSGAKEIFLSLSSSRRDRIGASALLEYARMLESGGQARSAAESFAALAARFPSFADLAAEGLFNASRIFRDLGDGVRASRLESQLKKEYPQSVWVMWLRIESRIW
jgi:TolA-binding protein